MSLLSLLLIGLIAGLLTSALLPRRCRAAMGWQLGMLMGAAGALLATYLGVAFDWFPHGGPAGWFAAGLGAIALPGTYALLRPKA